MGRHSQGGSHDTTEVDVDSDDLRDIIAAVQKAEVDARQCHERNERQRQRRQTSSIGDDRSAGVSTPNGRLSGATYSSDDASLQNGRASRASSVEQDRELRAAARREEQQFQNLREKRAALEEKLQRLSISLREDGRTAKRARYQLTDKIWNWLNSAFMAQSPSVGVHLGPDHVNNLGVSDATAAASSDGGMQQDGCNGSCATVDDVEVGDPHTKDTISSLRAASEDRQFSPSPASYVGDRWPPKAPPPPEARTNSAIGKAQTGYVELHASSLGQEPVPHAGEDPHGKRKLSAIMAANHPTHLRWLEQAEAAQAVLQSSHEVLKSSHAKAQDIKVAGAPSAAAAGPSGTTGASNGFLSMPAGCEFSLGHGGDDHDRLN